MWHWTKMGLSPYVKEKVVNFWYDDPRVFKDMILTGKYIPISNTRFA